MERPADARQIRIEDVDRAIKRWFDERVDAHVVDQRGTSRKVPVLFAAGERWVSSADERGIRDRDGKLILPVLSLKRMSLDPVNAMSALGTNVPRLQVSKRINDKTSILASNDLSRPISDRRLRSGAVYEIYTIPFPFVGIANYQVVVQSQYMHQLNTIVEKMVAQLEFYDVPSFVVELDRPARPEPLKQGEGSTENLTEDFVPYEMRTPLDKPYVVGYLDGDFGDSGNLEEFTDDERIVEMKFNFKVPITLQLDPEGTRPAVQKELTAFNLELGDEETCFVDDPLELDLIFGPR